jgi:hypothetical protein
MVNMDDEETVKTVRTILIIPKPVNSATGKSPSSYKQLK